MHLTVDPLSISRSLPYLAAPWHSKYLLSNVIFGVDVKRVMLVCVYTIVVFDLNDVELQDFWIAVVGWD